MSQITIYLDDDTEKRARTAADATGDSLSKWIAGAIREKTATTWPQHVLDLAGSWPDFPFAEELRRGRKNDSRRETF
ncbi:MAG: CopG family transcriptional regulator [Bryobacteraceae bacterium]|jgi:hypothetical protein